MVQTENSHYMVFDVDVSPRVVLPGIPVFFFPFQTKYNRVIEEWYSL